MARARSYRTFRAPTKAAIASNRRGHQAPPHGICPNWTGNGFRIGGQSRLLLGHHGWDGDSRATLSTQIEGKYGNFRKEL
ncbi:hypothetical protein MWU52_15045 [Jannaschia sp. S6380]|uniref:hypothetical protein n=1 Tax=Jannaschia sp. S6380 TaxID=2926408 RepID=UPI001FF350E8|nr:hypothetical protein [Jannaschia sp. S6380]MCK0168869.1 hypothetical protein [Jannaschia sp. S6380]